MIMFHYLFDLFLAYESKEILAQSFKKGIKKSYFSNSNSDENIFK